MNLENAESSAHHPRYIAIALSVAERITQGEFEEQQKIKGRSTLAGEYNVSPETIRRSMALLADLNVIEILPNSGILVKSRDKAFDFLNKFSSRENLLSIRTKIKQLIGERNELNKKIDNNIDLILESFTQLKNIAVIKHYECVLTQDCNIIGKTISELHFWQNTGATIIGVMRNNELLISPGPYFAFTLNDVIIFVGTEDTKQSVKNFITK